MWPVAFVGGLRYEAPRVNAAGKVVGWKTVFDPHRPFAIDMAGFAVNLRLILQRSQAYFKLRGVKGGYQESSLLRELVTLSDLEPKAANCTKVRPRAKAQPQPPCRSGLETKAWQRAGKEEPAWSRATREDPAREAGGQACSSRTEVKQGDGEGVTSEVTVPSAPQKSWASRPPCSYMFMCAHTWTNACACGHTHIDTQTLPSLSCSSKGLGCHWLS